tara:strand:- start:523 stop:1284 length:762 start_codon:yes stop_codon:yes gene_type:complete
MKIKILVTLAFLSIILVSCKEKDLTLENPVLDKNNVVVALSSVYDGHGINRDSVIVNSVGNEFFIDSLQVLVTNFYMVDRTDTIDNAEPEAIALSTSRSLQSIAYIEPKGYQASFNLTIGLDSIGNITHSPSTSEGPYKMKSLYRGNGSSRGYNHIIIYGRLIDPANENDSTGTIPLLYKIGTPELQITASSLKTNFAVSNDGKITLILYVDLKSALDKLDLKKRPKIDSDPSNSQDITAAETMLESLNFQIF